MGDAAAGFCKVRGDVGRINTRLSLGSYCRPPYYNYCRPLHRRCRRLCHHILVTRITPHSLCSATRSYFSSFGREGDSGSVSEDLRFPPPIYVVVVTVSYPHCPRIRFPPQPTNIFPASGSWERETAGVSHLWRKISALLVSPRNIAVSPPPISSSPEGYRHPHLYRCCRS